MASSVLRRTFPQKIGVRILGTKVVGGIAGRAVPFVGWGLLAYDAIAIGICTEDCISKLPPPEEKKSNSMNNEDIGLPEVFVLLQEYVGQKTQLKANTTLFGDLCIYGDDAVELIESLHKRFDVDVSSFVFSNHFLPEAYSSVELILLPFICVRRLYRRYLSHSIPEESENLIPITAEQLAKAIRIKSWPANWSRPSGWKMKN